MLIEFIGAAGVGKSYLSDRVLEPLQSSGKIASNFDLLEIHKTDPRNLWCALKAGLMALATRPVGLFEFMHTATVLARYSIRRKLCARSEHVFVTSEGLFHRMITIHRQSRSCSMIQLARILFRQIRPSDLVVVVEADAEAVFARRSARNRAGDEFTRASVEEDLAIVRDSIEVMRTVQQDFRPLMHIIRVTADEGGAEPAVGRIMASLGEMEFVGPEVAQCKA